MHLQNYLEADDKMCKIDMEITYYDTCLTFLEEISKTVANEDLPNQKCY